jgi:hypothetical protein
MFSLKHVAAWKTLIVHVAHVCQQLSWKMRVVDKLVLFVHEILFIVCTVSRFFVLLIAL